MHYEEDPNKVRARGEALRLAGIAAQGIPLLLDEIRGLVRQLDYAVGGMPSGTDCVLTDFCRIANQALLDAQSQLGGAQGSISGLQTGIWVPDETEGG